MTVTDELLDLLKSRNSNASDYRVAKLLGLIPQTVSAWRVGKAGMSCEVIIKACQLLDKDPLPYVLRRMEELAKSESEQTVWHNAYYRLAA